MNKKLKKALIQLSSFLALLIIAFIIVKISFVLNNNKTVTNKETTNNLNNKTITTKTGSKVIIVKEYDKTMFENKQSIVFFWASWCTHCTEEVSVIQESMDIYKNRDFNIYAFSHDNDLNTLIEYIEKENITFDIYFDLERITRTQLDPSAFTIPLTYLIDKDFSINKKHSGAIESQLVKKYVNYIENNH